MDVKRLKSQRDLLADWMYIEMEEHAKKLEIYADLFDKAQNGIDVDTEFMETMIEINKFTEARKDSKAYTDLKASRRTLNIKSPTNSRSASAGPVGNPAPTASGGQAGVRA